MRLIKTLIAIVMALALLMLGVLLTVNNQEQITVDLVFVHLPEASIARWVILSFLLGAILSIVVSSVAVLALRARLISARRQLRNSNKELDKLRTLSLKDSH